MLLKGFHHVALHWGKVSHSAMEMENTKHTEDHLRQQLKRPEPQMTDISVHMSLAKFGHVARLIGRLVNRGEVWI